MAEFADEGDGTLLYLDEEQLPIEERVTILEVGPIVYIASTSFETVQEHVTCRLWCLATWTASATAL
jgi:hypothetical protein